MYFCDCVYFSMSFYLCAGVVSGMTRHHQKALVHTCIYVMYDQNQISIYTAYQQIKIDINMYI